MGKIINMIRILNNISLLELSEKTNISMYEIGEIIRNSRAATKSELGRIFFFLQSKFTEREFKEV